MGTRLVDRPFEYRAPSHFLKTQCLCGELQIVVTLFVRILGQPTVFVFDRIRRSIVKEFDDVRLADQPQPFAPQWQGPLDPAIWTRFEAGRIDARMHRLAA